MEMTNQNIFMAKLDIENIYAYFDCENKFDSPEIKYFTNSLINNCSA